MGLPRHPAVAYLCIVRPPMEFRAGSPADAEAIAGFIASFQSELTDDPSGAGAERDYLASERYRYLLAYLDSQRHCASVGLFLNGWRNFCKTVRQPSETRKL